LQGKVAHLLLEVDFRCNISFILLSWGGFAEVTTICFSWLKLLNRTSLNLL